MFVIKNIKKINKSKSNLPQCLFEKKKTITNVKQN